MDRRLNMKYESETGTSEEAKIEKLSKKRIDIRSLTMVLSLHVLRRHQQHGKIRTHHSPPLRD